MSVVPVKTTLRGETGYRHSPRVSMEMRVITQHVYSPAFGFCKFLWAYIDPKGCIGKVFGRGNSSMFGVLVARFDCCNGIFASIIIVVIVHGATRLDLTIPTRRNE